MYNLFPIIIISISIFCWTYNELIMSFSNYPQMEKWVQGISEAHSMENWCVLNFH